jgi:hypothetical protein
VEATHTEIPNDPKTLSALVEKRRPSIIANTDIFFIFWPALRKLEDRITFICTPAKCPTGGNQSFKEDYGWRSNQGVDDENMKSKVELTDEELAQIAELVRENFEVYGYDPDSHTDRMLQSIFRKITGSEWCKQG